MQYRSPWLLVALVFSLALSGCGRGADPTAPVTGSPGLTSRLELDFTFRPLTPPTAATQLIRSASMRFGGARPFADAFGMPGPNDSVFIAGTFASPMNMDWQAVRFVGFLRADGTFDRQSVILVPNEERVYQMILFYRRDGVPFMMYGTTTLNGVVLTAIDYTPYVMWSTFRFVPPGMVDPIRDDRGRLFWSECLVDGFVHPDSTNLNVVVTGADRFQCFSTDTRLVSHEMIFVDASGGQLASWRQPVLGLKGAQQYFIRVNRPAGQMMLPGVKMKNADGSYTQCMNVFDIDTGAGVYFVFELRLDHDGVWRNPRPADERWAPIVIRTMYKARHWGLALDRR